MSLYNQTSLWGQLQGGGVNGPMGRSFGQQGGLGAMGGMIGKGGAPQNHIPQAFGAGAGAMAQPPHPMQPNMGFPTRPFQQAVPGGQIINSPSPFGQAVPGGQVINSPSPFGQQGAVPGGQQAYGTASPFTGFRGYR